MKIKKREAANDTNPIIIRDSDKNKPHFFKIIISPLAQKSKLRIPVEFVKRYGRHLSDDIYLSVPNSEQLWHVKLEKDNNAMFLGKGWQNFMEFYSLNYSHLLVFRFDGGLQSQFHVLILDNSATEIDYPVRSSCDAESADSGQLKKGGKEDKSQEANDISLEMLDGISPKQNQIQSVINLDTSDSEDDVERTSFNGNGMQAFPVSVSVSGVLQAHVVKGIAI